MAYFRLNLPSWPHLENAGTVTVGAKNKDMYTPGRPMDTDVASLRKENADTRRYLALLVEQLEHTLNNLDEENLSNGLNEKLNQVEQTGEALTSQAVHTETETNRHFNDLRNEIVQNATTIRNDYSSSISQAAEALESKMREEYTAKTETSALQAEMESRFTQTASDITQAVEKTETIQMYVDGELREFVNQVKTYQRFSEEGLEIGRSDSDFKSLFSNVKLSFMQNGVEIAYVSNNKLYITNAEVLDTLSIGNPNHGFFVWDSDISGMALKWRG